MELYNVDERMQDVYDPYSESKQQKKTEPDVVEAKENTDTVNNKPNDFSFADAVNNKSNDTISLNDKGKSPITSAAFDVDPSELNANDTIQQTVEGVHMSDSIKSGVNKFGEAMEQMAGSQIDVMAEEHSEGYDRTMRKGSELLSIANSMGIEAETNRQLSICNMEGNRYIAGDILGSDKFSKLQGYMDDAQGKGVYKGWTSGMDSLWEKLCKDPYGFMPNYDSDLELDEEKMIDYVQEHEKFNEDGSFNVPQNKKWRKKADKAEKMKGVNELEEEMRRMMGTGVFSEKDEEILQVDNKIFDYKKPEDLKRSEDIIDKYLLSRIDEVKTSSGEFIDLRGEKILPGQTKKITKKDLDKMDIKDLKRLKETLKTNGIEDKGLNLSIDALMEQKRSEKHIGKSQTGNYIKQGANLLGMDEMLSGSDVGEGIGYISQTYRSAKMAAKVGIGGVELTEKGVSKAANKIAPKQMESLRNAENEAVGFVKNEASKAAETVLEAKPVQKIRGTTSAAVQSVKETKKKLTGSLAETTVGKAANTVGNTVGGVVEKTVNIITTPFRWLSDGMNFFKSKVMIPVFVALGGFLLIVILMVGMGGMGGSTSGSVAALILSEEEQFADYQRVYDACDSTFQNQIAYIVNGNANTTNLKGQAIGYGVNTTGVESLSVEGEYQNGVTLNYYYGGVATEGISSNIEDCLSAMTIIMQQEQSQHHEEALELLEALYKSTHSYTYSESALYGCTNGCESTHYYCNIAEEGYDPTSELMYSPWIYGDIVHPTSSQECEVCKEDGLSYENYAGCTITGTCYHGDSDHYLGDSKPDKDECSNYRTKHCSSGTGEDRDTWTEYYCKGHDHYGCPSGHDVATCFGHVSLTMSVNIAPLERIFEMGGVPVVENSGSSIEDKIDSMTDDELEDYLEGLAPEEGGG